MRPDLGNKVLLVLAAVPAVLDGVLLALLVGQSDVLSAPVWLLAHAVLAALGSAALALLLAPGERAARLRSFALCFSLAVSVPFVGALGSLVALVWGSDAARRRHREDVYWQFTQTPALPFTLPGARTVADPEGRGLVEQLAQDTDHASLYRKVLAAGRMPSSLSIHALRAGVAHSDERIRLTSYQTIDRKVNALNDEIDRLVKLAQSSEGSESSDAWLQVASNYWELLTLEQMEPVARTQILKKASKAAQSSIRARSENRNAHFTLGRIALRQGHTLLAEKAFARAELHGMPTSTTLPYRAEVAFADREFGRTRSLLDSIGEAFKGYPPLRQVAEYWR